VRTWSQFRGPWFGGGLEGKQSPREYRLFNTLLTIPSLISHDCRSTFKFGSFAARSTLLPPPSLVPIPFPRARYYTADLLMYPTDDRTTHSVRLILVYSNTILSIPNLEAEPFTSIEKSKTHARHTDYGVGRRHLRLDNDGFMTRKTDRDIIVSKTSSTTER